MTFREKLKSKSFNCQNEQCLSKPIMANYQVSELVQDKCIWQAVFICPECRAIFKGAQHNEPWTRSEIENEDQEVSTEH